MYHLLAIGLVCAALFLSVALVTLTCIRLCWRRRNSDDLELGTQTAKVADCPETPNAHPTDAKVEVVQRFAWTEIKSLTNNFAPVSLIGEGGFSSVYLARLPIPSAIKVHHSSERLHRAFRQELDVLLRLRHPHIVRLLGYSDDHPDDGALVFEYVPGGTLHDRLHGGPDTVVLPWARRMSMAHRLAEAVAYLHEGCDPQVVHGDIKAANVLLDGRMDPKLCDFGSSTMGFSAAVRSSAAEKPTIVGSLGYVDPHYLRTGMVSKKSDVYTFGVLLLELVTGAEAFCSESERSLMATVGLMLREGRAAEVVVDPRLGGEYDATEAAVVIEVAGRCVGEHPSLRPSMVEVLRVIREKVSSASISAAGEDRLDCRPDL